MNRSRDDVYPHPGHPDYVDRNYENVKALVVLSGGMDSTTVLYRAISNGREVEAISFDYGQKHKRELALAKATCDKLDIKHTVIDLKFMLTLGSQSALQSDTPVPEGHYEHESMKDTVVYGRNLIFASVAASYAENNDCVEIWMGVHAGDHAIYPDCRPLFIETLKAVIEASTDGKVTVMTPYLVSDKQGILRDGYSLQVDYSLTTTCYNGAEEACGKCGSCQERLEAFEAVGEQDPIAYAKG